MLNGAYGAGSKMATGAYPCVGTDGYHDIAQGAAVTLYDDAGKIVATGGLGGGKALGDTGSCVFPMQIDGIPDGSKFYQVEVSHRGKVTFNRDDLAENKISLTSGVPESELRGAATPNPNSTPFRDTTRSWRTRCPARYAGCRPSRSI